MTETDNYRAPTAAFCRTVRAQYGLTMPVLYDPNGDYVRTMRIQTQHYHIVLGPEGEILFKRQYDDQGWRPVVEAALSR